jgi:hypothetical protein
MFVKLHHSQINIDLSTLASGTMTSGAQLSKISNSFLSNTASNDAQQHVNSANSGNVHKDS